MYKPTEYDNQIDWNAIAPDVALRLKGEPRTKSHTEWRWGNKGSFAFYSDKGTFRDYEAGVSGGVIDMVSHCEGLDKQQAIQWLVDNNFLSQNNTATRPRPPIHKPKPTPKLSKMPHDPGNLEYGLRLWNESRPVPIDDNHPARHWSAGLLAPTTPVPDAIRFHREKVLSCAASRPWRTGLTPTREHPCPKLRTLSPSRHREKSDFRQNGTETTNEHSGALMAAASSSSGTRAATPSTCAKVSQTPSPFTSESPAQSSPPSQPLPNLSATTP